MEEGREREGGEGWRKEGRERATEGGKREVEVEEGGERLEKAA